MSDQHIRERAKFDQIRYANCWEDATVLCAALQPSPGKRILSIASGGDNSFALAAGGAEVIAVDLSQPQLAMVEIKRAAIQQLDYDELLAFLGIRESSDRQETYDRLAQYLPRPAREFWDAHGHDITRGVIHAGKFEHYFEMFRRWIVPLFHRRPTVDRLLAAKSEEARHRFYDEIWDNWRWRLMFRMFFSRTVMGRFGRDPEFFRFVEGPVADRILERTHYAFTTLPTHENPYLQFIFTGNYRTALPRYLERERFESVREGAGRLVVLQGSVESVARSHGPFDGFNLSDIFEYLDPQTCEQIYRALLDSARPGARLAYWNMLAPRRRPEALASRTQVRESEARELFRRDLAFFYSAFVLEEAT